MNFGATVERCPSTPGLYQEKSPTTSASSPTDPANRATPRQRQNLDVQLSGPRAGTPLRNL